MSDALKPRDGKDVEAAVGWALAEGKTLEVIGHGSKRGIGHAAQWDMSLDLSDLSGVTLYEPEELILSAKAGTPIAEIETLLAANNQELAFEPMDYGPVFGAAPGRIARASRRRSSGENRRRFWCRFLGQGSGNRMNARESEPSGSHLSNGRTSSA